MLDLEEFLMLRDLFNKELSISEIARRTGHSRGTVRKYLRSQVPPTPQERSKKPSKLDGYREYFIQRLQEYPISAKRIYREIQEKGFTGKYNIVKDFIREVRPKATVCRYEICPS
jgi:transposase